MKEELRVRNLSVPAGKVDVVLDTDAFNEIDDQYAIAYLLRSEEKLCAKAIYAAPFKKTGSDDTPAEGMELSYQEILHLLALMGKKVDTFRGPETYLPDEQTPVESPAALDLASRANDYSPEHPLYVVAIGAITNVASAILLNPKVAENTVVIWLGGHAQHFTDAVEFNLKQDIAAARVVFGSGVPLVQLPCKGVVSSFTVTKPELETWFFGKNELADYLARITIRHVEAKTPWRAWSKPLWDVTAVAWLLNEENRFMRSRLMAAPMPSHDGHYTVIPDHHLMNYVYYIERDALMDDLIEKLTGAAL